MPHSAPHGDEAASDDLPHETARLAKGAQGGDLRELEELYTRTAPALFAWTRLRIQPALQKSLDAEDVMQEVWLRAVRQLGTYDAARGGFRAWILAIAKNVLLEGYRRHDWDLAHVAGAVGSSANTSFLDQCPDSVTAVTSRLARDESIRTFLEWVEALDPDDKRLLLLCGFEEYTCAQAAVRLNLTVQATHKRWQRLRDSLRESQLGKELALHDVA